MSGPLPVSDPKRQPTVFYLQPAHPMDTSFRPSFRGHRQRWPEGRPRAVAGGLPALPCFPAGVSLASIRLSDVGSGMLIGGLRIVLGAAVGWGIGVALDLETLERAVLVMQSAMPVAVFNYLLAVRANQSPEQVANVVMCSTVLSFAWLPLVLAGWM